jgi:hypothetical protein
MRAAAVAVALAAVSTALALVVGCSSFGAAEAPGTGSNDGGTGDDGGGLGSSGGADATPDGLAAVVCDPSFVAFDESFGAGWENRWNRSAAGSLHADSVIYLSPPASLAVDLIPSDTAEWIERDLGLPCHVHAEVQLHVGLKGDGDVDLFTIEDAAPTGTRGVAFIFVNGGFAVEHPQGNGVATDALGPVAAGWLPVALDVDVGAGAWSASFGGVTKSGSLPPGWPAANRLVLKAGAPWENGGRSAPWSIRFDDVAVR